MPMDKHRLQEVWRGGYCEDLVRALAPTDPDDHAGLHTHVKETWCRDCIIATRLKNAEAH